MNILFLMIRYSDAVHSPNLYTDLAVEFKRRGNNVYVVTLLEKRDRSHNEGVTGNAGVTVLHVRCGNIFNVGFITKGITTVTLPFNFRRAIRKYFPDIRFDLVLTPTPPITFLDVVRDIKRKHGASAYLILRDIFPQNARDLGLMGNEFLFRYFRRQEKKLYDTVDHIGCMSPENERYLVAHNDIDQSRIELLPNWRGLRSKEAARANGWLRDMDGKFVAMFGGVIGIAQELEFLMELANEYRERDDVWFAIFGDGNRKQHVMRRARELRLQNVKFYGSVSANEFTAAMDRADIGLVNLNRNFTIPNFPSKTLDYFDAGKPVLAAVDENTDYGRFLEETESGLWSVTGDLAAYKHNFECLLNDREYRTRLGANGRTYLQHHLSASHAYDTIMRHYTS